MNKEIIEKWDKSGLLDGINDPSLRTKLAIALDSAEKVLPPVNVTGSVHNLLLPFIRRVFDKYDDKNDFNHLDVIEYGFKSFTNYNFNMFNLQFDLMSNVDKELEYIIHCTDQYFKDSNHIKVKKDNLLEQTFIDKNIDLYFLNKNLVQKKVCMQKDIGVLGNLFGGNLLAWIDESAAGYIYQAINFRPVVTLKISEVLFKAPVKVNDVINILCTITNIGKSSITVVVEVLNTHSKKEVCTCELVFVHVDPVTLKSKEI